MKKAFRIKKNEEFQMIIKKRKSTANAHFVIYFSPKKEVFARVGISVSKKLGDAHIRNKIKRQVRMIILESLDFENYAYDLIVIVRNKYLEFDYASNKKGFQKAIKQVK